MLITEILKSAFKKNNKSKVFEIRNGENRFKNSSKFQNKSNLKSSEIASSEHSKQTFCKIYLKKSDIIFQSNPEKTIIENSLRQNVEMKFSCMTGGCGACKVRKISGNVNMKNPNCLNNEEISNNYILACISYACDDLVLDI